MMTSYDRIKDEVLECYVQFLEIVRRANMSKEDRSLAALESQAEKIKEDKFCLIVAGEAKSGKSTFINAYLGTEILPTGVWQCTSSLIEICYGEEFILRATFADGHTKQYAGEEQIKKFLLENAALRDEYRCIPVPTINNEIIVKYHDKTVPEGIIRNLLKSVAKENLERLPQEEYENRIREYIKVTQPQWGNIVVKIDISYPFEDKGMKGVSIMDSPGVNAAGKVGDITASYIKSANAIIFLRPILGADIAATGFKNFLESNIVDRNRNAMFLVLTRTAGNSPEDNQKALNGFTAVYGTQEKGVLEGIVKEQIIPVDSKAECYYNYLKKMSTEEIKTQIKTMKEKGKSEPFLREAWLDAEGDKGAFLRELKKDSNFDVMRQSLNRFGHRAQFIALNEFLDRMLKVYEKITVGLGELIADYELKAEDPVKLAARIEEAKAALGDMEKKMNETAAEILKKYKDSDANGLIEKRAEEVMRGYLDEIEKIDSKSNSGLDMLEKLALEQVEKFKDFQEELQKKIVAECNEAMVELSDNSVIPFVTLEPDFSEEVIKEIKDRMREEATKESFVNKTGTCGKKIKEALPKFMQDVFYDLVKSHILEEIEKIKKEAVDELRLFVTHTVNAYEEELRRNMQAKEAELNKIKDEKKTAEEIASILSGLKGTLAMAETQERVVKRIKGGLDTNV